MKTETTKAVREIRQRLGDTQQAFAQRTGLAISTVVRYELSRPPKGKALTMFEHLAAEHGHQDLQRIFRNAALAEAGISYGDYGGSLVQAPRGLEAEFEAFKEVMVSADPLCAEERKLVMKGLKRLLGQPFYKKLKAQVQAQRAKGE